MPVSPTHPRANPAAAGYDPLNPPPPPRGNGPITMWRFTRWMAEVDVVRTALVLGAEILGSLLLAAAVWAARYAFGDAVEVYQGVAPAGLLLRWVALWILLTAMQQGTWPAIQVFVERLRQELEDSLQIRLQRKAAALRLEVFERADFYDILGRARKATAPGFFTNLIPTLISLPGGAVTLGAMAVVVGRWSPWLLVAVMVAAIPGPLAQIIQSRASFFLELEQTPRTRLRTYLAGLLTSRQAAAEVRTFALGPWLIDHWRALYWSVADETFAQQLAQSLAGTGTASLSVLGLAGGLGFAAWGLLTGRLQPGQFAAMLLALQAVQSAMGQVTTAMGESVGNDMLTIADLFVYLDIGPEELQEGVSLPGAGVDDIILQDVCFRYPQRERLALLNISLVLHPGERVALVGANGAGKTTLVKVLTGLYRPTKGRVLYGEHDLATLEVRSVRDRQAAVFQDHIRYAFTLSDNVGYGRADLVADRPAVKAAAERGGAASVAAQLQSGYDTPLTKEFTGGTDLSVGQWQRVAVSRGFMRLQRPIPHRLAGQPSQPNPGVPLVIMDEPTAALDPKAEAEVFRHFSDMAGTCTAVLVSHRLGFARLCDRVLVLSEGRLLEQGTHDELMAAGGVYAAMWQTQSQWYR